MTSLKPTAVASCSEQIAQTSAGGTCFRPHGRESKRVKDMEEVQGILADFMAEPFKGAK